MVSRASGLSGSSAARDFLGATAAPVSGLIEEKVICAV